MEWAGVDRPDRIREMVWYGLTGRGCPCMIYQWMMATPLLLLPLPLEPHRFVEGGLKLGLAEEGIQRQTLELRITSSVRPQPPTPDMSRLSGK